MCHLCLTGHMKHRRKMAGGQRRRHKHHCNEQWKKKTAERRGWAWQCGKKWQKWQITTVQLSQFLTFLGSKKQGALIKHKDLQLVTSASQRRKSRVAVRITRRPSRCLSVTAVFRPFCRRHTANLYWTQAFIRLAQDRSKSAAEIYL